MKLEVNHINRTDWVGMSVVKSKQSTKMTFIAFQ